MGHPPVPNYPVGIAQYIIELLREILAAIKELNSNGNS